MRLLLWAETDAGNRGGSGETGGSEMLGLARNADGLRDGDLLHVRDEMQGRDLAGRLGLLPCLYGMPGFLRRKAGLVIGLFTSCFTG